MSDSSAYETRAVYFVVQPWRYTNAGKMLPPVAVSVNAAGLDLQSVKVHCSLAYADGRAVDASPSPEVPSIRQPLQSVGQRLCCSPSAPVPTDGQDYFYVAFPGMSITWHGIYYLCIEVWYFTSRDNQIESFLLAKGYSQPITVLEEEAEPEVLDDTTKNMLIWLQTDPRTENLMIRYEDVAPFVEGAPANPPEASSNNQA